MKLFPLLMFSSIFCINVYGGELLVKAGACCIPLLTGCSLPKNSNLKVSQINVHFYDFQPSSFRTEFFQIDKAAKGILSIHNLNKHNKFFMYIGGYRSHINSNTTELMRNALKNINGSYLLIVDHSAYTHSNNGSACTTYKRSVEHVPNIGKKIAEMLVDLKTGGISPSNIHGIGHSLGSQMLGYVGENFNKLTGQKISRITALDPAGPCFDKQSEHVRSGLAKHVEVYHCNANRLGSKLTVGDVDFFANNGKSQPQCGNPGFLEPCKSLASAICSHSTCVTMWVASVKQTHWYPAYNCQQYDDFKRGKCYQNKNTTAGFWNPGTATGKYYFSTTDIEKF